MIEDGRDLHELHALMAPRPFLVSGGSEDPPERWKALNHAVAVNKLLGLREPRRDDQPPGPLADRGVERAALPVLRMGTQGRRSEHVGTSSIAAPSSRPPPGPRSFAAASYARIPGANDRIGVGFIGYGLMAKKHVATFRAAEGCDVVAMSEVHRGRLEEGRRGGRARARRRLTPTSASCSTTRHVNAVVIATPDHWHALMTMLACAAGKDVYVEKPLTLFVREGEWMQTVAETHKRVVQVGTQQRSGKHYQQARDLIRGGHIGKVVSVRMPAVRNVIARASAARRTASRRPDLDYDTWLGPAPARKYNPNRGSTTSAGSGTTPAGR